MANALYDKGREGFADGSFTWTGSTIAAALISSGYTVNLAIDEFLSAVGSGNIIASFSGFTTKTDVAGVVDADDVVFSAVPGGSTGEFIVIYVDTGDPTTSRLIAFIDTAGNLPVVTNGGDITVAWDGGANKIFKL